LSCDFGVSLAGISVNKRVCYGQVLGLLLGLVAMAGVIWRVAWV